ncbi:hypothetical protein BDR04DRAFT_1128621 [Suillus decipiens]|nr:hypothetical protein BDR04DRAFT_1128621 [Suillus decipiens]
MVQIRLLKEKMKWISEDEASVLEIPGVYHHSLTDIITSIFQDSITSTFHMMPFQQQWKVSEECTVKVYSEAYMSHAFSEAYEEVNSLHKEPNDDLKHVVASLMMWSDATHLTNFGDTSLWPFYLLFGNQSKYTRGKLTVSACHHVVYIHTIPGDFQDTYFNIFADASSADIYTHCKRELMQAIWALLLDEKFLHSYKYDGITRHIFPTFFSYSADYPEKILLACIKFLGKCLYLWCLIKKSLMFKQGASINGQHIQSILNDESLVPTQNAFSEQLAEYFFNFFALFIVDLLHEFELRVWKAIFTHLMHILFAAGGTAVQELNWRHISKSTYLWMRNYLSLPQQCISNEMSCSLRL